MLSTRALVASRQITSCGAGPAGGPHRHRKPVGPQMAHHRMGTVPRAERGEHEGQAGLHLLVRIEGDGPGGIIGQAGRNRQAELTASCLLSLTLVQTKLDLMQFRFAHDAGQAEQQTVMIGTRVKQPLAIGDQHAEQRAQFQQLMPVAIVARQARGVEADDQAGMAEADLGDQLLEARTFGRAGAGLAEILVDDVDPLARPAPGFSPLNQTVLQLGTLLMLLDLGQRGLAHVDIGQLGPTSCREVVVRQSWSGHHLCSPGSAASGASAAEVRPEAEPSASGSRAGGSATVEAGSSWSGSGAALPEEPPPGATGRVWPWPIPFCADAVIMVAKCCASGSRVRTLTRRASSDLLVLVAPAKSVMDRRTERRRPSGSAIMTKAGPRAECTDTSSNCCPIRA